MAFIREGKSAPKPSQTPTHHGGHKRMALTTRKHKPDGTTEVSHKVEHSFDPVPLMRKMKMKDNPLHHIGKTDGRVGEDAMRHILDPGAHGGPAHRHGTNLQDTLRQLRTYQHTMLAQRGAFAGDGMAERSAPAFRDAYDTDIPYAPGYAEAGMSGPQIPDAQRARDRIARFQELIRQGRAARTWHEGQFGNQGLSA